METAVPQKLTEEKKEPASENVFRFSFASPTPNLLAESDPSLTPSPFTSFSSFLSKTATPSETLSQSTPMTDSFTSPRLFTPGSFVPFSVPPHNPFAAIEVSPENSSIPTQPKPSRKPVSPPLTPPRIRALFENIDLDAPCSNRRKHSCDYYSDDSSEEEQIADILPEEAEEVNHDAPFAGLKASRKSLKVINRRNQLILCERISKTRSSRPPIPKWEKEEIPLWKETCYGLPYKKCKAPGDILPEELRLLDLLEGKIKHVSKMANELDCAICLEPISIPQKVSLSYKPTRSFTQLVCGHLFHFDCIGSAVNIKGTMECPNCRHVEKGNWKFSKGTTAHHNHQNATDILTGDCVCEYCTTMRETFLHHAMGSMMNFSDSDSYPSSDSDMYYFHGDDGDEDNDDDDNDDYDGDDNNEDDKNGIQKKDGENGSQEKDEENTIAQHPQNDTSVEDKKE